jgi:hypothetical protein
LDTTVTAASDTERRTITISHTNKDGTLVTGTQREDGSREPLRAAQFKWSRRLGMWFMPQSRGRAARRGRIDQLAAGLRTAGFEVNVELEQYDPAAAFDAMQNAAGERTERLADRAHHQQQLGEARSPAGSDANERAAREHHDNAARAAEQSDAAVRQARRRENPVVMGRKMERLEAEERQLTRILQTATGDYAEQMRSRLTDVRAELAFLQTQIEQSGARKYAAADFKPGDLALVRGRWRKVKRVNRKTLAFETPYSWTDNYPYHEVTDRRATHKGHAAAA